MKIEQYYGFKAENTNVSTANGKVGLITQGFSYVIKDEDHILQFKIIDMLNVNIFDWIYLIYENGQEQKLPSINISNFETVGDLDGKYEKLCYIKFKPDHTGMCKIGISRRQTVKDVYGSIAFLIREIDLKEGYNLSDFTTNTKEDSEQRVHMFSQIQQIAGEINMKVGRNDIISSINLSPEQIKLDSRKILLRAENVMVSWNNINDSIQLHSDELAMYGENGKRLSMKRGLINTYKDTTGAFLGFYGMDRTYEKYYGTSNIGSNHSYFYGIAKDSGLNNDTDYALNKEYLMYAVFVEHENLERGCHFMSHPIHIWKHINLRDNNIIHAANIYFASNSRLSSMANGGLLVASDVELRLGIQNGATTSTGLQMVASDPSKIFAYKHIDMQGYKLLNVGASTATFAKMPITMSSTTTNSIEESKSTIIDNIDIVDIGNNNLGVIPKNFSEFKDNEFDKDQLLFSLAKKVKDLENKIKELSGR